MGLRFRLSVIAALMTATVSSCNPIQEEAASDIRNILLDTGNCAPIVISSQEKIKVWSVRQKKTEVSEYTVNNKAATSPEGVRDNAESYYAAYPSSCFNPMKGKANVPVKFVPDKTNPYKGFPATAYELTGNLRKLHFIPACNFLELRVRCETPTTLSRIAVTSDTPFCGTGTIGYLDSGQPYIVFDTQEGKRMEVELGEAGILLSPSESVNIILPLPAWATIGNMGVEYTVSEGDKKESIIDSPLELKSGESFGFDINAPSYGRMTMEERIARAPLFHHMNVEAGADATFVPSQSIIDIKYAKALGFNTIEANVHRTADGKYVVKHGDKGTLGKALKYRDGAPSPDGDIASKRFEEVSSQWLRDNVVYDSRISGYCVPIPTLEEFAVECRDNDIAIVAQIADAGVLPILQSILPDNMIVAYDLNDRSAFGGMVLGWKGHLSASDALSYCRSFGPPLCYSWSQFTSTDLEESLVRSMAQALHSEGYILGTAYATPAKLIRARKLGFDWIASCNASVNDFDSGNLHNVTSLDQLEYGGGKYTLYDASCKDKFVKVDLKIRYSGTLSISIGKDDRNNACGIMYYQSDGSEEIEMAIVSQYSPYLCNIFVEDPNTVISSIQIAAQTVTIQ
ncbi:MAG: hypothetical protein MJY43_05885 [Bacteroidales bacterium]|nr:hypothetical protein [Bacteroidales bacterium]